jgi:hypothetical protein
MLKISDSVEKIVSQDGFAIEAMHKNLLNFSSYAKIIHPQVEEMTIKPVKIGSIVVALTRISKSLKNTQDFLPNIDISGLTITSFLSEITYERSTETVKSIQKLQSKIENEFFTVTLGTHEVTIICSADSKDDILSNFNQKPKVVLDNLVAISVRFSDRYMLIPNTIFSLVNAVALRKINLIEIVSTYTELTFVIYKDEMENTIQAINQYTRKSS